jgi:ankyrin repeat protein
MDELTQALFDAIWDCDIDGARRAVSLGASLSAYDEDGDTPLTTVPVKLPMVRLLLQLGADPNQLDSAGLTALMGASATADIPIATALLEAGATIGYSIESGKGTLLNDCLQCGNNAMALLHLQYASKSDLDLLNISGYTPLMLAVAYRNGKMLNALLAAR